MLSNSSKIIGSMIKRIMNPRIVIPLVSAMVLIIFVTNGRAGDDGADLFETAYQYFFSGPGFLSQLLMLDRPGFNVDEDFQFGWMTLGFFANILPTAGLVLGLGTKTSVYWVGSVLTSSNLVVGDGQSINAMCTVFYDFLLDWGTAGAIIGPALLGVASMIILNKFKESKTVFWACISVYWLHILFRTVFKWDPIDITFTAVILFIYLFTRNARKKEIGIYQTGSSRERTNVERV